MDLVSDFRKESFFPPNIAISKLKSELSDKYGVKKKLDDIQNMFLKSPYIKNLNMPIFAAVIYKYNDIDNDTIGFFSGQEVINIIFNFSNTEKINTFTNRDNYIQNWAYILYHLSADPEIARFAELIIPYLSNKYINSIYTKSNKIIKDIIIKLRGQNREKSTYKITNYTPVIELDENLLKNLFKKTNPDEKEIIIFVRSNEIIPNDIISLLFRYAIRNKYMSASEEIIINHIAKNSYGNYIIIHSIGAEKFVEKDPAKTLDLLMLCEDSFEENKNSFENIDSDMTQETAEKINKYKVDMYRYYKFIKESKIL